MHHRHACILALVATLGLRVAAPVHAQTAPTPWRSSVALAVQDISGNRTLRVLQSTIRTEHRVPDRYVFAIKLEGGYGKSSGEQLERRLSASFRFDLTPRAGISPFLGLDWDYNRILRINSRVNSGAGVNFIPVYGDSTRVTIALGVVEEYKAIRAVEGSPGATTQATRLHSRLAFAHTFRTGVQLELNGKYQPIYNDPAAYLFKADGTVRMALTSKLRWETTYRWWRDSRPATGIRKDDRALASGLSFQF